MPPAPPLVPPVILGLDQIILISYLVVIVIEHLRLRLSSPGRPNPALTAQLPKSHPPFRR
ncbi:MAG: hypothetical protein ACR2NJ_04850 [Acidimicrobiales bacterium]